MTHEFKLKVGEYTFKGECEYTDAGLIAWKETGEDLMPDNVASAVRTILELLAPLPEKYTDFELFKVSLIEV
jgi:hypothetical protein